MKRPDKRDYCNPHGFLVKEEDYMKAMNDYIDCLEKQTQESDCISSVSNLPVWLKEDDVKTALALGKTYGKLRAVKHLHKAAMGHIENRLTWAKEFYETCC